VKGQVLKNRELENLSQRDNGGTEEKRPQERHIKIITLA